MHIRGRVTALTLSRIKSGNEDGLSRCGGTRDPLKVFYLPLFIGIE